MVVFERAILSATRRRRGVSGIAWLSVAVLAERSLPNSSAGAEGTSPLGRVDAIAGFGGGTGREARAAAGTEGAASTSAVTRSSTAIGSPTGTTDPSAARISRSTPVAGAGTSASTLSVVMTRSASSSATGWPGCTSQRSMMPSATDSPSCGIVTNSSVIDSILAEFATLLRQAFGFNGIGVSEHDRGVRSREAGGHPLHIEQRSLLLRSEGRHVGLGQKPIAHHVAVEAADGIRPAGLFDLIVAAVLAGVVRCVVKAETIGATFDQRGSAAIQSPLHRLLRSTIHCHD